MNYNEGNNIGRIIGALFVGLYVLLFGGLMLWGGVSIYIEDNQQGLLVDFGTTEDSGSGTDDTLLADDYSLPQPTSTPEQSEPVAVQEQEESPVMEEANIETDMTAPEEEQKAVEETPVEEPKPREVNVRALFPGNTTESESPSEGITDVAEGNQGYIGGTESDNYEATGGEGGFEPDWNLEGRRPRTSFPKPKYLTVQQGIVIVDIWVNSSGDVTGAAFHPVGSTVSASSPLVAEALKAARGVKFDESDQDIQVGTITYNFRLNTGAQ